LSIKVYTAIPIGIALSPPVRSETSLIALAFLLASFHINNVVLFYLSSALPPISTPPQPKSPPNVVSKTQLTSLRMMPALIEGTESFAFFTIMTLLPSYFVEIAVVMAVAVGANVAQRTWTAREAFQTQEAG